MVCLLSLLLFVVDCCAAPRRPTLRDRERLRRRPLRFSADEEEERRREEEESSVLRSCLRRLPLGDDETGGDVVVAAGLLPSASSLLVVLARLRRRLRGEELADGLGAAGIPSLVAMRLRRMVLGE